MSVPNTNTFGLRDVSYEVFGDYSHGLTQCFANATGTFDANYVGSKDRLSNFRNYNHAVAKINCYIGFAIHGGTTFGLWSSSSVASTLQIIVIITWDTGAQTYNEGYIPTSGTASTTITAYPPSGAYAIATIFINSIVPSSDATYNYMVN